MGDKEGCGKGKSDNGEEGSCIICSGTTSCSTRSESGDNGTSEVSEEVEALGSTHCGCGIWCSCGIIFPPGAVTTTSAHTLKYGELGWNMIPAFLSSPQFLRRAISKSNLLLATT